MFDEDRNIWGGDSFIHASQHSSLTRRAPSLPGVLKNLSKCDEARLVLLRSTECTKLLLGVSRILARLPERRKLFKRAYRTLWLLFCGLVPQLPGADVLADEELGLAEQQPAGEDEMHNAVFPESQVGSVPEKQNTTARVVLVRAERTGFPQCATAVCL